MTIIQVHLLMLGLGLLAYLFLSGPLGNRRSLSTRLRRQWWMGLVAAVAVTASPLSRFWRNTDNGLELLTQSLLIAAICLLALMLFALLYRPVRALFRKKSVDDEQNTNHKQPITLHAKNVAAKADSTPIVINADDDQATPHANAVKQTHTNTTDAAIERSMSNPATRVQQKVTEQDKPQAKPSDSANKTTAPVSAAGDKKIPGNAGVDDQANITKLSQTDIESVVQMQAKNNRTHLMDNKFSHSTAANDNKSRKESLSINIDADEPDKNALDLSETEQLFAELREQKTEVNLPNEDELRQAKADSAIAELDFDTSLVQEPNNRHSKKSQDKISADLIEEAEVVEIDDASLDFGNNFTGEYSHPDVMPSSAGVATVDKSQRLKKEVHVPATLDAAIVAAKVSAKSLQTQVSSLENSIAELDDLRDSTMDATIEAAEIRAEHNNALLRQKDNLLRSENEARAAAESVIAAQSTLIDRAKRPSDC